MKLLFALLAFAFTLLLSDSTSARNLEEAMTQSAEGMRAQGARMKVVTQNIANAESTGDYPGAEPYRRKIIFFKNKKNPRTGLETVTVQSVANDKKSQFKARFDPEHPAADENGYVLYPNVDKTTETVDMKEAERSYGANLGAIETSKRMYLGTIDLLR